MLQTGHTEIITAAQEILYLNSTALNGGFLMIQRNGGSVGKIGCAEAIYAPWGTNEDMAIWADMGAGSKLFLEGGSPGAGGSVRSNTIANDTDSNPPNVYIVTSDGRMRRTTHANSSRRYKTAIEPFDQWRWFLDLTPVEFHYREVTEQRKHGGFLAEEVAEKGPTRNGRPLFAGLNAAGEPDTIGYDNLLAVVQLALRDHDRRLAALEHA